LAVAESQGIQSEVIPGIATGFCSGIARTGNLCGALSGAIMGLGCLKGRSDAGALVDEIYLLVQELVEQFEGEFGGITCYQLTGVCLGTEEGQIQFREMNKIQNCYDYVEGAVTITNKLIQKGK
jgi:C_GCAxxG_C_C family probable redox protein